MIKCPNCNQENPDGSRFCSTCGNKLEVFLTCPSCGAQVQYGSAFCPKCGKNLKGEDDGVLSGGSVVAGDVTSNSNNVTTNTYNTTSNTFNNTTNKIINFNNQTFTEVSVKCHACGKSLLQETGDAYKCAKCGENFCPDHFSLELKLCNNCRDEANRMLHSGMYDEARSYYVKAIANGTTDSDAYYYASICLLRGKRPFVQQRSTIDAIVGYMNKALMLEKKAVYYYFIAYIKYDYFEKKYLKVNPNYRVTFQTAVQNGLTQSDVSKMYSLLGVERPSCL